jgi:hypothetical protein
MPRNRTCSAHSIFIILFAATGCCLKVFILAAVVGSSEDVFVFVFFLLCCFIFLDFYNIMYPLLSVSALMLRM